MGQSKVILIELNELTPHLLDQFMSEGHLPNFSRLHRESHVQITDAEESGEALNPWVQWVSVHTGLTAQEHGVMFLSEGCTLDAPAIWDQASEAGMPVLVCGSMNARYDRPLNGVLIPDPWSSGLRCYPEASFKTFYEYVRHAVQEHTNPNASSPVGSGEFLRWMRRNGLSLSTALQAGKQILAEKLTGKGHWRRASILDLFQFDVFLHWYRKLSPRLATYFANSTAHYQHRFWRHMQPELFEAKPSSEELAEYGDAIRFGYQRMDRIIGRFLDLCDDDTTLVLCTALSQQPYLAHETSGGRFYYRISSSEVLKRLGVPAGFGFDPVMAEQFVLRYDSPEQVETARQALARWRTGDRATFHVQATEDGQLMVQSNLTESLDDSATVTCDGGETHGFFDLFYRFDATKSAHHHPDGVFWLRTPAREHSVSEKRVPLTTIAPTVLDILGIEQPTPA